MDGFEAPSFSLGLDEEIHQRPESHAVAPPSNPFRISAHNENGTVSKAADTASVNRTGSTDYDSDFEIPLPKSPERIMKRLRKSGQFSSASSYSPQQAHEANDVSKPNAMGSQNVCKGLSEKKTGLTRKIPSWKTDESNKKTLHNFWQGLSGKAVVNSAADSGCKNLNESKARCIGQGSVQPTMRMPMDLLARTNGSQTGASQVCAGTTLDFSSGQHSLASKEDVSQGHAEGLCSEIEGLPSQRSYGKKEPFLGKWGACRGDALQSFESCIDVNTHEELPIRNSEQSRDTTLESLGNSMQNQKANFQQGVAAIGKGKAQTFQANLGEECDFLDDFSFASSMEKMVAPVHSSWRSSDGNLSDDFSTGCERQNVGKSAVGPKMTPKDQVLDVNTHQTKEDSIDTCQTKTNALNSFWRSLNEKKLTDIVTDDDDIENCSSDNDFEINTPSAKKFSFFGNATAKQSSGLGSPAAARTFGQNYPCLFQTSANATANNCSVFHYLPNKIVADDRAASCSVPSTFSRSRQSFVGGASRNSPVHNEAREFDDCGAPAHASIGKASQSGASMSYFVNPALSNNPRITNLLQARFPHFRSITALIQGDFMGSEQVYIDYGNQFLGGGKGTSSQSGPRVLKQEARQTASRSGTKWRQASQKKQKVAMEDNDGWIQTGNRSLSRNRATKSKRVRKGKHGSPQTPVNADFNSGAGPGHWVTERSGKRIYVTKDGQKLSGSSAYKQHMKDSGKRFKKTKRRRPRKAK